MWRNAVHDKSISIHAPRTGSDEIIRPCNGGTVFQSTLPARGATHDAVKIFRAFKQFQSTLPARGATWFERANAGSRKISIHAPRTGSDMGRVGDSICAHDFNPRSPHGERPGKLLTAMIYTLRISIHAPRTGSDRPSASAHQERDLIFQSTLPARGATVHIVPR